jgi:uncharacterized protein with PQ loop repeat
MIGAGIDAMHSRTQRKIVTTRKATKMSLRKFISLALAFVVMIFGILLMRSTNGNYRYYIFGAIFTTILIVYLNSPKKQQ